MDAETVFLTLVARFNYFCILFVVCLCRGLHFVTTNFNLTVGNALVDEGL